MPKSIPFPTGKLNIPAETKSVPVSPEATRNVPGQPGISAPIHGSPMETRPLSTTPKEAPFVNGVPAESPKVDGQPENTALKQDLPPKVNLENSILVDGEYIEIKPTLLKYFRNQSANSYGWLNAVPLDEFMSVPKGTFDKDRDSDQILLDFLVAAFDDVEFVRKHYDEFTAADIDRIVKIFGRINGIEEKKEAARKNREAQAKR